LREEEESLRQQEALLAQEEQVCRMPYHDELMWACRPMAMRPFKMLFARQKR
jgi:hypothetical protein